MASPRVFRFVLSAMDEDVREKLEKIPPRQRSRYVKEAIRRAEGGETIEKMTERLESKLNEIAAILRELLAERQKTRREQGVLWGKRRVRRRCARGRGASKARSNV